MDRQRLWGVGFWELDHALGTLYRSEEIYSIYAISEKAQPDFNLFQALIHDDEREDVLKAYWASVESGEEFHLRYRVKCGETAKWINDSKFGVLFIDVDDFKFPGGLAGLGIVVENRQLPLQEFLIARAEERDDLL